MRSHIKIENYGEVELFKAESDLQEQGYRLVRKQSEKDLLPGEYIRQEFSRFFAFFRRKRPVDTPLVCQLNLDPA
jgi:hypothetical protein